MQSNQLFRGWDSADDHFLLVRPPLARMPRIGTGELYKVIARD